MILRVRHVFRILHCATLFVACAAVADEVPPEVDSASTRQPSAFRPPEGSTADLLAFIRRTKARFVEGKTREQRVAFVRQQQQAICAASEAILARDADAKAQLTAHEERLGALWQLVQIGEPGALEAAVDAAANLPDDAPQALVHRAAFFPLWARWADLNNLTGDTAAARLAALSVDVRRELTTGNHDALLVGLATELPNRILRVDPRHARTVAEEYADALSKGDSHAQAAANHLQALAKRWALVGQPLAIEGRLADGRPLDQRSLEGRVVLVEFWATWCQPCIAEFPNLLMMRDKYHAAGFEIVAVSLDEDRSQVQAFLRDNELPWPVVCGHSAEESGMRHPLVKKCAVDTVPRSVLVDRRGNVAAVDLRGEQLSAAIERLLDEPVSGTGGNR
jgi:thiol-disulfide isomerase/thioredoxin